MGQKLLFVHGTGVRKAGYDNDVAIIKRRLERTCLEIDLVECLWGEKHGVDSGTALSVPQYYETGGVRSLAEADFLWNVLLHNPAVEMEQLVLAKRKPAPADTDDRDGLQRLHQALPNAVKQCFRDEGLDDLLAPAVAEVQGDYIRLLQTVPGILDMKELGTVLARATVARLLRLAAQQDRQLPNFQGRGTLIDALEQELIGESRSVVGTAVKAMLPFLSPLITSYRGMLTDLVRNQLGDILRYQARGEAIRSFIAERLQSAADSEVTILAHSLGGIASLETLVQHRPKNVKTLVTFGSQAPLLYELGALSKLPAGGPLPDHVPPWVNFFDLSDPLSYVAENLFPGRVTDHRLYSGANVAAAHSAYLDSDLMWELISDHLK